MRLAVAFWCFIGFMASACDRSDGSARDDEPTLRPLSMHPVVEVGSGQCKLSGDLIKRSPDGSTCYSLSEGLTTTSYRAERAEGAGVPEIAIEVTLAPKDMDSFNALAKSCFEKDASCPRQQIAIVYGDEVLSAPTVQEPSFSSSIMITAANEDDLRELLDDLGE